MHKFKANKFDIKELFFVDWRRRPASLHHFVHLCTDHTYTWTFDRRGQIPAEFSAQQTNGRYQCRIQQFDVSTIARHHPRPRSEWFCKSFVNTKSPYNEVLNVKESKLKSDLDQDQSRLNEYNQYDRINAFNISFWCSNNAFKFSLLWNSIQKLMQLFTMTLFRYYNFVFIKKSIFCIIS